jgi:hypothetical protein
MAESEALRQLLQRFVQTIVTQLANRSLQPLHLASERRCRWLLIAHDSARSDSFCSLTNSSR